MANQSKARRKGKAREKLWMESVANNVSGAAATTAAASGLVQWELQPSDLASPALP